VENASGSYDAYDPEANSSLLTDNFSSLIFRRIVTLGDEYEFPVKCSSDRCYYGKPGEEGGKAETFKVCISETITNPETGEEEPNEYGVKRVPWDSADTPASDGIGVDPAHYRFLVTLPKETERRRKHGKMSDTQEFKLVMRLASGEKDDSELRRILNFSEETRATRQIHLRTVGVYGTEKSGGDWRTASYDRIPLEFFNRLSLADIRCIQQALNDVDGGFKSEFDAECPVCHSKLVNTDNNTMIPFMSESFFSERRKR
jgi:hypothetical protein